MSIFGLQSPGLAIIEQDFTNKVPGASSSIGGFAGAFQWGPVLDPQLIDSERTLVEIFGLPKKSYNRKDFFSVAYFMKYTGACYVTRVVGPNASNAVAFADPTESVVGLETFIPNKQFFDVQFTNPTSVDFVAKYPGSIANGIEINIIDALTFPLSQYSGLFQSAPQGTEVHIAIVKDGKVLETFDFLNILPGTRKLDGTNAYYVDVVNEQSQYIWITGEPLACSTILRGGTLGAEYATYSDIARSLYPGSGNGLRIVLVDDVNYTSQDATVQGALVGAPEVDEVAIVVIQDGFVRETFEVLSKDSLNAMYYVDVFNEESAYADLLRAADFSLAIETDFVLSGATNDVHPGDEVISGYALYEDPDTYDISLMFQGAASNTVGNYILALSESRRFTVGFVSPQFDSIKVGGTQALNGALADRAAVGNTSYGFMDSNWCLVYDVYNRSDVWIPGNPISAGLQAQVDSLRGGPWYVGYGPTYGRIANVKRLAWEPTQAFRDELYKNDINTIATFRGDGILLNGSKTLQGKPSAFDRLNVRRVFIFAQKSIARSMRYFIGELNTEQTRLRALNAVTPFLRDLQSRQALYRFFVKCDAENNSEYVNSNNGLAMDIAISPSMTIDFIGITFSAVGGEVDFEELFG